MNLKVCRRWFSFGLAEVLVLVALLSLVGWWSATRPVTYVVPKGSFRGYAAGGTNWFAFISSRDEEEQRLPGIREAARRGLPWCAVVAIVWLAGCTAASRWRTRAPREQSARETRSRQFRIGTLLLAMIPISCGLAIVGAQRREVRMREHEHTSEVRFLITQMDRKGTGSYVDTRRRTAARRLGDIGPAARSALPALYEMAADPDPLAAKAAVAAISRIES